MFEKFQGGRVGRRCCVAVMANLDNLHSGRLCLQQVRDGSCLPLNLNR